MAESITYFSIDVEASGPVPGLFNMVSLGAVPVHHDEDGQWKPRSEEFYVEIKPAFEGFETEAMEIHKLTKEHLDANGVDTKEAMEQLNAWTLDQAQKTRAVFVGHNAPFDWMNVAYYFAYAGLKNPYGYNALDTKALAMGKLDLHWLDTNKERLAELLQNLPALDTEQVHNAVYDARYQAILLCELLNRPK